MFRGSSSSPTNADETIETLREELSELYKKKAINDQQLIDANLRVGQLEKRIAQLSDEKDQALRKVEEVKAAMADCERRMKETEQTNQLLNDEFLALHAIYNAINEKFLKADAERTEVGDGLKLKLPNLFASS